MRILIISLISLILSAVIGLSIYFSGHYRSAFEADQDCHFILSTEYSADSTYGCDHDLETRQWLLYKQGGESEPSKVIQRFIY